MVNESPCDIKRCDEFFSGKKCMCYSLNKRRPREEQICGYYENGILYECNDGCCAGGCPNRRCIDQKIIPKEPDNYIPADTLVIEDPQTVQAMFKFDDIFAYAYVVLTVLILISIDPAFGLGVLTVLLIVLLANKKNLKNATHGIPVNLLQLWPLSSLSKPNLRLWQRT